MSMLQQILKQIQDAQNSGTTLADAGAVVAQLQAQLLEQLVAAVTALQGATPASAADAAPVMPTTEQWQALIQPLVSEAISATFGRLESAATTAEAQPAVAENTGSGAAPLAPSSTAASESADKPPAAAGTAPNTQA